MTNKITKEKIEELLGIEILYFDSEIIRVNNIKTLSIRIIPVQKTNNVNFSINVSIINNHSEKRPERVLCKRTSICGDDYYFDEITGEKIIQDNRDLVKGVWYDIVPNPNDGDKTFSIIDNKGNRHLFYMYDEEDKINWPSFCKDYGPRDYAKWFYTPEELEKKKQREQKHHE